MTTLLENTRAPEFFGPAALAKKEQELQNQRLLEETAKSLALRLGTGMEDVSFREFVDLVRVVLFSEPVGTTATAAAIATPALCDGEWIQTASSSFPCHNDKNKNNNLLSLLVEQDAAPEHRKSSVLRTIYFSSLNALHQIEDPPVTGPNPNYDELLPPMAPICAKSSSSSSTASSWSSVSIPGESSASEDETTITQTGGHSEEARASINPSTLSFHFVSAYDDDDDDDDETALAANNGDGSSSFDDGESMASGDSSLRVFVEEAGPSTLQNRNHTTPSAPTLPPPPLRIELPHDFEVVTVVNDATVRNSGSSSSSNIHEPFQSRARTYSVTTTVSAPPGVSPRRPQHLVQGQRSRSEGGTTTTRLSHTFRKLLLGKRSKSTASSP